MESTTILETLSIVHGAVIGCSNHAGGMDVETKPMFCHLGASVNAAAAALPPKQSKKKMAKK